jgi:hypothetical protein
MTDSGWFFLARISKRGRVKSWEYQAGARPEDLEFMSRVTDALPRLAETDSPTERIYREPKTEPTSAWFRK